MSNLFIKTVITLILILICKSDSRGIPAPIESERIFRPVTTRMPTSVSTTLRATVYANRPSTSSAGNSSTQATIMIDQSASDAKTRNQSIRVPDNLGMYPLSDIGRIVPTPILHNVPNKKLNSKYHLLSFTKINSTSIVNLGVFMYYLTNMSQNSLMFRGFAPHILARASDGSDETLRFVMSSSTIGASWRGIKMDFASYLSESKSVFNLTDFNYNYTDMKVLEFMEGDRVYRGLEFTFSKIEQFN